MEEGAGGEGGEGGEREEREELGGAGRSWESITFIFTMEDVRRLPLRIRFSVHLIKDQLPICFPCGFWRGGLSEGERSPAHSNVLSLIIPACPELGLFFCDFTLASLDSQFELSAFGSATLAQHL